jgi:hypothetical protein
MAAWESDFPPLLELGWHRMSMSALRALCVEPFPSSATREMIMAGLEAITARLVQAGVTGDLWIDGSFLTEKINPKDSDVALCIDSPSMYDFGSPDQREAIKWLNGNLKETSFVCDSYVIFTYPIVHCLWQEGEWWKTWYQRQFGFSRDDDPKGIVVVSLPDDAR